VHGVRGHRQRRRGPAAIAGVPIGERGRTAATLKPPDWCADRGRGGGRARRIGVEVDSLAPGGRRPCRCRGLPSPGCRRRPWPRCATRIVRTAASRATRTRRDRLRCADRGGHVAPSMATCVVDAVRSDRRPRRRAARRQARPRHRCRYIAPVSTCRSRASGDFAPPHSCSGLLTAIIQ
jgi:hypothetical protein